MNDLKIYRHILVISDNLERMMIHHEYATRQLELVIEETNNDEQEIWRKYLNMLQKIEPVLKELDNNVEIEGEKKKYKNKLFKND